MSKINDYAWDDEIKAEPLSLKEWLILIISVSLFFILLICFFMLAAAGVAHFYLC